MDAPDVVSGRRLNTGDPAHLLAIGQRHGRILPVPTLGELLTAAGRRLAVIGSGSPGQTLLQNPHGAGWTINKAISVPATLESTLRAAMGPMPERGTPPHAPVDAYLQRSAFEHVLPVLDPDLLVLWSCEPDSSLHRHGLGSPEVAAALSANDARLGEMLDRIDLGETTVIFLSDHGHSTVRRRINLRAEVAAAGIVDPSEVVCVGPGIHLRRAARARLNDVAAWLERREWCGPLFVRDALWQEGASLLQPASTLWDGAPGRWVPDIVFSMAWDDEPNAAGVPGHTFGVGTEPGPVTDHGTLAPRDMNNVLILSGAGVRQDAVSSAAAGTIDIAPTVLHLLEVQRPAEMQGRVLREAFDGVEPTVTLEPLGDHQGRLVRRRVDGAAYVGVS